MRIAWIDPCAGIAGDMLVGALIDAGAPFEAVETGLRALDLDGASVACERVARGGVGAAKFKVVSRESHHHRGLRDVLGILDRLPPGPRARAAAAFRRLAEAEARIHGVSVDQVHFHEVGAVDAICDVAGAALALDALRVESVFCRPLPLSAGTVDAAHGRLPLPAPATLELLRGRAVYESGLTGELVTPTGAACVAAWAEPGDAPPMTVEAVGYGAGDRDPDGYANVCRVAIGESTREPAGIFELVCDVDDATPETLAHLAERLFEAGALDATLQPVVMKKGRMGTRVTALARAAQAPAVEERLFAEGVTLGVRRRAVERTELPREVVEVNTDYGRVRVKLGLFGGRVVRAAPEHEDVRARAMEHGVALLDVARAALQAWQGSR